MNKPSLQFIDNSAIKGREEKYTIITVNAQATLKSWKSSLFSFEWLTPDGKIRSVEELGENEKQKFHSVSDSYKNGDALERPILGIGILDNVEIGSRRDVFLTLAASNINAIPAHVLKQDEKEFADYIFSE